MIFISAGHHPSAPGARWERFVEHDEALIWAQEIAARVEDSMFVPPGVLKSKVDFINSRILEGAEDVAIEVHFNAARDAEGKPVGRGAETLYYPGSVDGKRLAEVCQEALVKFFPPDRGVKEGWYRMDKNRGPDFFLAKTKCPAVILEPEFVHRHEKIVERRLDAIMALVEALNVYLT